MNIFPKTRITSLIRFKNQVFKFSSEIKSNIPKKKTHYEILEVPYKANPQQIRESYLRLAKLYHPDIKNEETDKVFHEINLAYQVLNDPKTRKEYDDSIIPDSIYYNIRIFGIKFNLKKLFGLTLGLLVCTQGYLYYQRNLIKKCPLNHDQKKQSNELQMKIKSNS